MKISVKKEKLIVFVGAIVGIASGYVAPINPTAAGVMIAVTAAVLTFWSEGINTETVPTA